MIILTLICDEWFPNYLAGWVSGNFRKPSILFTHNNKFIFIQKIKFGIIVHQQTLGKLIFSQFCPTVNKGGQYLSFPWVGISDPRSLLGRGMGIYGHRWVCPDVGGFPPLTYWHLVASTTRTASSRVAMAQTGKTGNLVLTFSRQGKHREFCFDPGKNSETRGKYFSVTQGKI